MDRSSKEFTDKKIGAEMSEIEICPLCESDLGHKIDCPLGSAWRDLRFKKCGEYIESLQQRIKRLEDKLSKIQDKVNEQAEDEGLWFNYKYITEDYLQRALRELHQIVEEK